MTPFCKLGVILSAIIVLSGCATQRTVLEDNAIGEAYLFVTRSAGEVTLSWESKPDLAYTVLYNHTRSPKSPWQVLTGLDYIRGTGRTLVYKDHVPENQTRFYRLRIYPAVSMSP